MQVIPGGGGRHLALPCTAYDFLGVEVFLNKVRFSAIDQYGKMSDNFTADEKYLSVSAPGCPIR